MEYLKRFLIGIVLAGGMLLPLAGHAFDIKKRNIVCQSETETQTEAPTEESTEKPKEKPKQKPEGSSGEEADPEEDCD